VSSFLTAHQHIMW